MITTDFTEALTEAEIACKRKLEQLTTARVYRVANPGDPDCSVFDIGSMSTGEVAAFPSTAYHWRASLEVYRRDRTELQRELMRILYALPVSYAYSAADDLRENSNVLAFRVAPEDRAVSAITTTDVAPADSTKPIPAYVATVTFDVVFAASR